ncbi:zf-HC2 domain-containing protein [Hydrogenophaga sp. ZJX-1]|uniref:zf-HC2 domain-containing protein n=1 Tax=Hydrogenophaga sp. ZJX-1 TaxID=3404778 RepID=UPI003B284451
MKAAYPFRRTCKEVSALLIAREDRELPLSERLALRLHLAMCQACPRFERQVLTMRNAMKQWRNYGDDE